MSIQVHLDTPHAHFTNLDYITGTVVLTLLTDTPLNSVVVKLEGESHSRLVAAKYPHGERPDKKRAELEVHKLLYKVETLFPSREVIEHATPNASYTLSPGTYEYPFRFRFPFNNDCINNSSIPPHGRAGLQVPVPRDTNMHIRRALPPSLTGFPGKAEIRYYVKATAARPQFYKENYRGFADIKFLPIERPRPKVSGRERYARRQQQFSRAMGAPELKKGLFGKVMPPSPVDADLEPPKFSVDARLPEPAILTCNEPLPLRVLAAKLNDSSETLFLQLLQLELIAYTRLRAQDLEETVSGSWVLLSQSRLNIPLRDDKDTKGKEIAIDPSFWNRLPLPNSVAPSFETCNITRHYVLEVRVGISRATKPELIVLPLRLDVEVLSGIAPPQELLDAVSGTAKQSAPVKEVQIPPPHPPRPARPQVPVASAPVQPEEYEEAPPSYEDAMAEALAPVDGPRREYNPLDAALRNSSGPGTDRKGSVGDDDRLFPNSGLLNASTESLGIYPITPVEAQPRPYVLEPQTAAGSKSPTQLVQEPQQLEPRPEPSPRRVTPNMGVPPRKPVPGSDTKSVHWNQT
ncbi:hypothetical protein AJ80_05890 [Polytolypa hystricis UAMH7299]|uniref:Arrestin-like N-terminal domain-containing protein n=1 Tax=Polytolypa hystricis (strain UAMH7299) TaxID=1447883 RepID=A0A2B7XZW9_POLH7|nr:hypothetical protein AJ80_05890 [Polytolypa hystricis UAMH7299]